MTVRHPRRVNSLINPGSVEYCKVSLAIPGGREPVSSFILEIEVISRTFPFMYLLLMSLALKSKLPITSVSEDIYSTVDRLHVPFRFQVLHTTMRQ